MGVNDLVSGKVARTELALVASRDVSGINSVEIAKEPNLVDEGFEPVKDTCEPYCMLGDLMHIVRHLHNVNDNKFSAGWSCTRSPRVKMDVHRIREGVSKCSFVYHRKFVFTRDSSSTINSVTSGENLG